MLLVHQSGSVKIGEVLRYTLTYTPAHDRILPSPSTLHLKIKNTSAIALRAAFIHGPYTLAVSAYPSHYNPNVEFKNPQVYGIPEFEPNLKAGGSFHSQLKVPEDVRQTAGTAYSRNRHAEHEGPAPKSVSWIIEIASQVIFSGSAIVHFEILIGRDEKSLSLGVGGLSSPTSGTPGQVSDLQQSQGAKEGYHSAQPRGIFSKAIFLKVEDTATLWNKPVFPQWDDNAEERGQEENADAPVENVMGEDAPQEKEHKRLEKTRARKKIHLVVLTHGLHGNLGADMLYMKESIDAAAKQAKKDARIRRAKQREERQDSELADEDSDDEEVIVRGYSGNAVRTERGIKYLGKRLAKYVLAMTYPDQPYRPLTKSNRRTLSFSHLLHDQHKDDSTHGSGANTRGSKSERKQAYQITSISFIAHSLGGLVQTYAVAYIQKHSPTFFDVIKPINFIALATPFLGLSNENPLYVKFALNFGLVGRTGQDLGLTWRAPTIARSGWGALVGNLDSARKSLEESDPGAKPLLRILPTGPAHQALKKFRNRTVYSNVVNDGIVPLRTSCLLFLDWQGLGRVEKYRREMGLVGTVAGWGWAELTGANTVTPARISDFRSDDSRSNHSAESDGTIEHEGYGAEVPQPSPSATIDDDARSLQQVRSRPMASRLNSIGDDDYGSEPLSPSWSSNSGPFSSLLGFFRHGNSSSSSPKRSSKIYVRSQTIPLKDSLSGSSNDSTRRKATSGESLFDDPEGVEAPPKTTIFESAGDILNPPLPTTDYLINPASRPMTIFHDRVYHPEDIPPPPMKKRPARLVSRNSSAGLSSPKIPSSPTSPYPTVNHQDSELSARDYDDTAHTNPEKATNEVVDGSAMKVEEKIARAYHRDLSWRKVLVRLEPDAHNNLIVRRMFPNAYGWEVVKHLVDTHFSDSHEARTRDEDEDHEDHAIPAEKRPRRPSLTRTTSETQEATDTVPEIEAPKPESLAKAHALQVPSPLTSPKSPTRPWPLTRPGTRESAHWSDRDFADSADDDSDSETEEHRDEYDNKSSPEDKSGGWTWTEMIAGKGNRDRSAERKGTDAKEIAAFLGMTPASGLLREPPIDPRRSRTPSRERRAQHPEETAGQQTDDVMNVGLGIDSIDDDDDDSNSDHGTGKDTHEKDARKEAARGD